MSIICPACNLALQTKKVEEGLEVDLCDGGCGGIWFDRFELKKLQDPAHKIGETFLKTPTAGNISVDPAKKRFCPKCSKMPLMRHLYKPHIRVEVDECPKCAGFWLDAGELAEIRKQYSKAKDL